MNRRRAILVTAFLLVIGAAPSSATEVMLQPISARTLQGQWEGVWRDKIADRIIVFYVDISANEQGGLTIVQGSPSNPFVEPFQISKAECVDGNVRLNAIGSGDAQGATVAMSGAGSALVHDGQIDATIEKVTRGGRKIRFDVRLFKLDGGFFRQAEQLVEVAKKTARRNGSP